MTTNSIAVTGKPWARLAGVSLTAAALGFTLFFAGCGDDTPGEPDEPTPAELAAQGWAYFEASIYDSAATSFGLALLADSTFTDAWNGLGWSLAYLRQPGTADSAAMALTQANERGLAGADAWCGLAAVNRDLPGALEDALAAADSALARDPGFVFEHDLSIDSLDLHLIRGQVLVSLGGARLAEAQAVADLLAPGNGLDPDSSATWIVDGETFDAYSLALLRLLQNLGETIGAELP